jgi:leucyl-tRNA synthetase
MRPPLLLSSPRTPAADRDRCLDVAAFLSRGARLEADGNEDLPDETGGGEAAAALLHLQRLGLLSYAPAPASDGGVEVFYTASREASERVFHAGPEAGFPDAVQKKQAATFRTSSGALFRFPPETGGSPLEVYITDWSPCPSACAVAVHPSHPFAADVETPAAGGFLGRYVRHPLTGDLLPVWAAGWVRPDFGTGAVLVNPAHDGTDLAFARAVGLPVRFALVPQGFDGSPATWPEPPVVKTGQSVRTGPYDGLPADAAAARYFEVLAARGLAERHRDLQAGRWHIGRLVPDAAGDLGWSPSRRRIAPLDAAASGAAVCRLADREILLAALTAASSPPTLVCPASEQASDLLALRLLVHDLSGRQLVPEALFLVQKVQETKLAAPPEVLRLSALVGMPIQQVAVVKQQVVEQVQRFLRLHQDLLPLAAETTAPPDEAFRRTFAKVKSAVQEGDPAKAFSLLLQAQKLLQEAPRERCAAAVPGYCVLAYVVTGLPLPDPLRSFQGLT